MNLIDFDSGSVLFSRVSMAVSFRERLVGLLGSASPTRQDAMCFDKCNSVHMIGMKFPIDVIYLDDNFRIVKLVYRLKPWRLSFSRAARVTIEVQAGVCQMLGLKMGQQLALRKDGWANV